MAYKAKKMGKRGKHATTPKAASPEMAMIAQGTQNPQMVLEHMKQYPGDVKMFGGSQRGSGRHAATNDIQFGKVDNPTKQGKTLKPQNFKLKPAIQQDNDLDISDITPI